MTDVEVRKLSSSLKTIDTRSARKELVDVARIGGKLGISGSQEIFEFVRAADQINVALSRDLGGNAEEAIRQVGKLVELFDIKKEFGLEQGLLKVGSAINTLGFSSTANEAYLVNFARRLGGVGKQADISLQDILGYGATLDILGQSAERSSTAVSKTLVMMFKDTETFAKVANMEVGEFTELLNTDTNEAFIRLLDGLNGNNEGFGIMTKKLDDLGVDGARAVGVLAALAGNTEILRKQQTISNAEFEKGTSLTEEFNIKNQNLQATLLKLQRRIFAAFINPKINQALANMANKLYEIIRIPIEKQFHNERKEVNRLVMELTRANTSEEQRLKYLTELKAISPKIVEGLNSENIKVSQLTENMKAYNDTLAQRIVLANLEDKEQKHAAKAAKALEGKLGSEATLLDKMGTIDEQIAYNTEMTMQERAEAIKKHLNEAIKQDTKSGILGEKVYNVKTGTSYRKQTENQRLLSDIATTQTEVNILTEEYNKSIENDKGFSKRIALMKELLGVNKGNSTNIFGQGSGSLSGGYVPPGDEDKGQDAIEAFRRKVLNSRKTLIEQEKASYQDRLTQAGIFGKNRSEMTLQEQKVLTALQSQHYENIQQINDEAFEDDIDAIQDRFDLIGKQREAAHNEELAAMGDNDTAKKEATLRYQDQEKERAARHLEKLILMLNDRLAAGEIDPINLEDAILSDESYQDLVNKIADLQLLLSKLKSGGDSSSDTEAPTAEADTLKTDIFGMSSEDWMQLFDNLSEGKFKLEDMLDAIAASANAYLAFTIVQKNKENQAMMSYESGIDRKKKLLEDQLDRGVISQEKYNKRVEALDGDLDDKKKALAEKQAKREQSAALFSAIVNTATAVVKALKVEPVWPLGVAMAALVGAMGGVQIAQISSMPMPQFYSGKYDVMGAQDGRRYSASRIANAGTGLVRDPAILVGEQPEIIIDPATTRNLMVNYPEVISGIAAARLPQYAAGSYQAIGEGGFAQANNPMSDSLIALMQQQSEMLGRLNDNIEKGITAKLLADDQYIDTHNDIIDRFNTLKQSVDMSA